MKILSLDISSISTGWSVFDNGELVDYGVIKQRAKDLHSKRLMIFDSKIKELCRKFNPDFLAAEEVFVGKNPKVHKILSLYHGIAYKESFVHTENDPLVITESEVRDTISKEFCVALRPGKNKEKKAKELTFDFINERYLLNFTFKKHNDITDAIAVGLSLSVLSRTDHLLGEFQKCTRSKKNQVKVKKKKAKRVKVKEIEKK